MAPSQPSKLPALGSTEAVVDKDTVGYCTLLRRFLVLLLSCQRLPQSLAKAQRMLSMKQHPQTTIREVLVWYVGCHLPELLHWPHHHWGEFDRCLLYEPSASASCCALHGTHHNFQVFVHNNTRPHVVCLTGNSWPKRRAKLCLSLLTAKSSTPSSTCGMFLAAVLSWGNSITSATGAIPVGCNPSANNPELHPEHVQWVNSSS